jgi:hypothetical protein
MLGIGNALGIKADYNHQKAPVQNHAPTIYSYYSADTCQAWATDNHGLL